MHTLIFLQKAKCTAAIIPTLTFAILIQGCASPGSNTPGGTTNSSSGSSNSGTNAIVGALLLLGGVTAWDYFSKKSTGPTIATRVIPTFLPTTHIQVSTAGAVGYVLLTSTPDGKQKSRHLSFCNALLDKLVSGKEASKIKGNFIQRPTIWPLTQSKIDPTDCRTLVKSYDINLGQRIHTTFDLPVSQGPIFLALTTKYRDSQATQNTPQTGIYWDTSDYPENDLSSAVEIWYSLMRAEPERWDDMINEYNKKAAAKLLLKAVSITEKTE